MSSLEWATCPWAAVVGGGAVARLGPSLRHVVLASVVAVVLVAVDGQGGFPGASARPSCSGRAMLLLLQAWV